MSVTTKRGDSGWTDMLFGGRVRKDDLRIHAVGTVDELTSLLGLAKATVRGKRLKRILHDVQWDLFIVSSELITPPRNLARLERRVDDRGVKRLEKLVAELERKVKLEGCCFLIPGENKASAVLDVCRSVARRAERLAVALRRRKAIPNPHVLAYLNRLSDLLYMLARSEEPSHTKFVVRGNAKGTKPLHGAKGGKSRVPHN